MRTWRTVQQSKREFWNFGRTLWVGHSRLRESGLRSKRKAADADAKNTDRRKEKEKQLKNRLEPLQREQRRLGQQPRGQERGRHHRGRRGRGGRHGQVVPIPVSGGQQQRRGEGLEVLPEGPVAQQGQVLRQEPQVWRRRRRVFGEQPQAPQGQQGPRQEVEVEVEVAESVEVQRLVLTAEAQEETPKEAEEVVIVVVLIFLR